MGKQAGSDDRFSRIRQRRVGMLLLLLDLLIVSVMLCVFIGYAGMSVSDPLIVQIIGAIRLPRVLLAGLVGAGLACAGMAMQAVFRNSMADPFIIGVSSGAAVGAAAIGMIGAGIGIGGILLSFTQPMFAFLGAIITVFAVYKLGTAKGKVHVDTLLLSGVAVAAFLGAMTSFMIFVANKQYDILAHWLLGSLQATNWIEVGITAFPVIIGILIIFYYGRDLNVLLLGEEAAHNLGGNPESLKKTMLAVAAIMTSVAVAFTGIIGFVGLMIPHMMRLVVGPDHRMLAPASVLGGASFLIWADALSRSVMMVPVGVVTALLGGPFFLFLLRRKKLRGDGE